LGAVRGSLRTTLAGLAAAVTHFISWRSSADLESVADRYVVASNNVSIDAGGFVAVSVEAVVVSVPSWR
jgi:hypothetical protein